jgi:hypothetical protein
MRREWVRLASKTFAFDERLPAFAQVRHTQVALDIGIARLSADTFAVIAIRPGLVA